MRIFTFLESFFSLLRKEKPYWKARMEIDNDVNRMKQESVDARYAISVEASARSLNYFREKVKEARESTSPYRMTLFPGIWLDEFFEGIYYIYDYDTAKYLKTDREELVKEKAKELRPDLWIKTN